MSNPNGDTPDQNKPQNAPGSGTDTPPKDGGSQPSGENENELERERARAATALKDKEAAEKRARDEKIARIRAEKELARLRGGSGSGDGSGDGSQTPSGNEDAEEEVIRANAEKQVFALIAGTQSYQELLAKDPTLKEVLLRNPLSLISDYIDAEDAADQVKKYLDSRVQAGSGSSSSSGAGDGGQTPPKDIKPPKDGGSGGATPKYTAEQIRNMSPEEWSKIPKEQRAKMMQGDFS